jgi:hypothetical protein
MSDLFTRSISARLLRVLAQAAEGYPNQGDVYFVARYERDANGSYEVSPWFSESEAAAVVDGLNAAAPDAFGVFGPFDTRLPYAAHPDQETVAALQVTTREPRDGAITTFAMGGAGMYDAMFCSAAAVIKFAVPYYTRVYSPEFAETVLRSFMEAPLAMMVHLPWSEYGEMEQNGTLDISGTDVPGWLPAVFERDAEAGYVHRVIHPSTAPRADAGLPGA